jgi:hypothetical protein
MTEDQREIRRKKSVIEYAEKIGISIRDGYSDFASQSRFACATTQSDQNASNEKRRAGLRPAKVMRGGLFGQAAI